MKHLHIFQSLLILHLLQPLKAAAVTHPTNEVEIEADVYLLPFNAKMARIWATSEPDSALGSDTSKYANTLRLQQFYGC